MKNIRLHYDTETGKIRGYYPLDLNYISVPKPFIEITDNQYAAVLHNEAKYRVQNKELTCIMGTAAYRLAEAKKFAVEAAEKITIKAQEAFDWGVIIVNEEHYINVNWKEYYSSLASMLKREAKTLHIKTYHIENDQYYLAYTEFSPEDAKTFLEQAIAAIDNYRNQFIPEKQNQFIEELNAIKTNKNFSGVVNFIKSIDYGYTLNESISKITIKI